MNKTTEPEFGSIKSLVQSIDAMLMELGVLKHFIINDQVTNKSLDYIANYNRIILAFDIEFHNIVITNNKDNYVTINKNNKQVSLLIREIGLMFLARDNDGFWNYLGSMFVNFNNSYTGNNIIYVLSKYATVTEASRQIMEKNDEYFNISEYLNNLSSQTLKVSDSNSNINYDEKVKLISKAIKRPYVKNILGRKDFNVLKLLLGYLPSAINADSDNGDSKKFDLTLGNIKRMVKDVPFNITKSDLNASEQVMFNKQMKTYYEDKQVTKRTLTKNQEKYFFDVLLEIDKNTCYVVKGRMDFIALKNSYLYINKKQCPLKFTYVYDIEIFNKFSHDKYGSATLLATFEGLSTTEMYKKYVAHLIDKILNTLSNHRAHNPLSDSLYTLAVAIIINANMFLTI